jgi:purine-nucleoside phosphorylase
MQPEQLDQIARDAAQYIAARFPYRPKYAIILGTGAGQLAEEIQTELVIDYGDIPHFPRSTALGHRGQLVCGALAGKPVLAMQGRFHLYEGYSIDQATIPIHTMNRLGVEVLFVTNASGGMNPKMRSGQIMLITSHIDLMFRSTLNATSPTSAGRPSQRSDAYDERLMKQAEKCGRKNGFAVHRGVYGAMLGPNFETRAEYRFLRRIGADVAGMSTVPEVTVAARYGMRVLGLSVITNIANPDILSPTSGQEVIEAAEAAAPNLCAIVVDAIASEHKST